MAEALARVFEQPNAAARMGALGLERAKLFSRRRYAEEICRELEGIVKSLETGQGSLAEAIESYERGVALRQRCEALLAEAEAKVQAIVSAPGGSPSGGPALRDVE